MNTGMVLQKGASMAQDLYVSALSSVYQPGKRIYHPSCAELSDAEIVEKLKRDPVIAEAIMYRKHLVAGRMWNVEPKMRKKADKVDKIVAHITEDALSHIERFEASKFNLAEAVFRGSSYTYIEGKRMLTRLGNDKVERNWWIPLRLRDVGLERFRQFIETDGNIYWELWNVKERVWKRVEHPEWFVRHIYEDTERTLNYGRGLIEPMYIFAYAKETIFEKSLQGIDRWALGILQAKIDTAKRTEPTKTTKDVLQDWLKVLEEMRTHHVLIGDKDDDVSVVTGGGEGHQMCLNLLNYVDNSLRILVLGANLPTAATAGGSYSLAQIQENSTEALIQFDRTLLAETLTRDLVGLFYRLNYPHFRDMGLGNANRPVFSIVQERRADPQVTMNIVNQALQSRIPLRKDEVYEGLGFSVPEVDDEIIEMVQPEIPGTPTKIIDEELPFKTRQGNRTERFQLSDKKSMLIIDNGLAADHAYLFSRAGYDVSYYKPYNADYPKLDEWMTGIRGKIRRVGNYEHLINDSGAIVVLDIGFGDLVDGLKEQGLQVLGANKFGNDIENRRETAKRLFRETGIDYPPFWIARGFTSLIKTMDNLFSLGGIDSLVVKVDNYRGNLESHTFNKDTYPEMKQAYLKGLAAKVGPLAENLTFIIERKIEGPYVSVDMLIDGKKILRPYQFGFEEHNTVLINRVVDKSIYDDIIDKLEPILTREDYIGYMSLEGILDEVDGRIKVMDIASRPGMPAALTWSVAIEDYADTIFNLARGKKADLKMKNEYVGYSANYAIVSAWTMMKFKDEEAKSLILSPYAIESGGETWLAPSPDKEIRYAVVLGYGKSSDEAINSILENGKRMGFEGGLNLDGIEPDSSSLKAIKDLISEMRNKGIDF